MVRTYLYWEDRDKNSSRVQLNATDYISPVDWLVYVNDHVTVMAAIVDSVFVRAEQVFVENETDDIADVPSGIGVRTGLTIALDSVGQYTTWVIPSAKDSIWETEGTMAGVVAQTEYTTAIITAFQDAGIVSPLGNVIEYETLAIVKAG